MSELRRTIVLISVSALLYCHTGLAQTSKRNEHAVSIETRRQRLCDWMTQSWTADDMPYKRIRLELEKKTQQQLHEEYRADKQKFLHAKDVDRKRLYRIGYALFRTRNLDQDELTYVLNLLEEVPPPYSYEYARMVYFCTSARLQNYRAIEPIGERLLAVDGNDYNAVNVVVYNMLSHRDFDFEAAMRYADKIKTIDPVKSQYYYVTGAIYFKRWFNALISKQSPDPEDARQVISYSQQYLNAEKRPTEKVWIDVSTITIRNMKKWLKENHYPE